MDEADAIQIALEKAREIRMSEERDRPQREDKSAEALANWKRTAEAQLAAGKPLFVYETIYLPVDSILNGTLMGGFKIESLQVAGLVGWQVVTVIPRTSGIGLTNTSYGSSSGETWGAGIGGSVIGVHVLLSRRIDSVEDQDFAGIATEMAKKVFL